MTVFEAQLIVAETLRQLGLDSGEITDRQARKTYGKWFADKVAAGDIRPVREGPGKTSPKYYRITEILALKAKGYEPARLIYKNNH